MVPLVFLLSEDAQGPAELFRDSKHGERQDAFRTTLNGCYGAPVPVSLISSSVMASLSAVFFGAAACQLIHTTTRRSTRRWSSRIR